MENVRKKEQVLLTSSGSLVQHHCLCPSWVGTAHLGPAIIASEDQAEWGWERKWEFNHPLPQAVLCVTWGGQNLTEVLGRREQRANPILGASHTAWCPDPERGWSCWAQRGLTWSPSARLAPTLGKDVKVLGCIKRRWQGWRQVLGEAAEGSGLV